MNQNNLKAIVEQKLNKKVCDFSIDNNPIYKLMEDAALKLLQRELDGFYNQIEFFYILDNNLNAYTFCVNDCGVICFTTGAIYHITELLDKMMMHEPFRIMCSEIGESKMMAQISVYLYHFLFYHEFAHLSCGHAKYLEEEYGLAFMSMFEGTDSIEFLDRQTLEFQADLIAASYFHSIINNQTDLNQYKAVVMALVILFELLALYDKTVTCQGKLYLPPMARFQNVFNIIFINTTYDKNLDELFINVFKKTRDAFYKVFRITSDMKKLYENKEAVEEHINFLTDNWKILYEKVQPYSSIMLKPEI